MPTKIFNGIMFKDLPIVNIKATMNNTIFNLTDTDGMCCIFVTFVSKHNDLASKFIAF